MGTSGVHGGGGILRRIVSGIAHAAKNAEPPPRAGDHLVDMWSHGEHIGKNPVRVGMEAAVRGLLGLPLRGGGGVDDAARGARRFR